MQYKFKVQSISTNKCAKLTAVNTGTEVTDSGQVTPNSIGPFSRVTVGKKALWSDSNKYLETELKHI